MIRRILVVALIGGAAFGTLFAALWMLGDDDSSSTFATCLAEGDPLPDHDALSDEVECSIKAAFVTVDELPGTWQVLRASPIYAGSDGVECSLPLVGLYGGWFESLEREADDKETDAEFIVQQVSVVEEGQSAPIFDALRRTCPEAGSVGTREVMEPPPNLGEEAVRHKYSVGGDSLLHYVAVRKGQYIVEVYVSGDDPRVLDASDLAKRILGRLNTRAPIPTPTPRPLTQCLSSEEASGDLFSDDVRLSIHDLPPGYVESAPGGCNYWSDDAKCDPRGEVSERSDAKFGVVQFEFGNNGRLVESVALFPDEQGAARYFAEAKARAQLTVECVATPGEGRITWRYAPLVSPAIGDETYSYAIELQFPENDPISEHRVVVRRGSAVYLVGIFGYGFRYIDEDLLSDVARIADAKIADYLAQPSYSP